MKLAGELDETFCRERTVRFVGGMIAPNPQCHAIARVGKNKLAIWLLFARQPGYRAFHLHMHPSRDGAVLRGPPDFGERHQIHNSIYHSFLKTSVGIHAPVAQKRPMCPMLVDAIPFHVGNDNIFSAHRTLGNDFAIGTADKTLPPKLNSVAAATCSKWREFMSDAVRRRHVAAIRHRVTALDRLPGGIFGPAPFLFF